MSLLGRLTGRETPASAGWIEAEALAARLKADPAPLVVDVRGADEFVGPLGHIAGAVNRPLPQFGAHVAELAGQDRPLVMVCRTDRRSAAAAAELQAAGAKQVMVLRGGMERWHALGLG